MGGTSQASPHVAGAAVLAQQLAEQELGRRLTLDEFATLLRTTGPEIQDGDDENDNVLNTDLYFHRLDMVSLAEAILVLDGDDADNPPAVVAPIDDLVVEEGHGLRIACMSGASGPWAGS